MANFLGNLLDKDTPAKKLMREVEGMELKKQSLIASVQNEIQNARQKIDSELYQIGADVYGGHLNGVQVDDKLAAHFDAIASLESFIMERETKMRDIASRYDEEIGMLNSQLGIQPQAAPAGVFVPPMNQPAPSGGAMAFCEKCGKPYTPGEDLFCMGCGAKLA
jgi:hypothetical protein